MTVWYDETVVVVGLAVKLGCEVQGLFSNTRVVWVSLVSFSIFNGASGIRTHDHSIVSHEPPRPTNAVNAVKHGAVTYPQSSHN